ncbi:hypothetical protein [Lacrimispora sp. 38-1]|uniref:hypothetical protein n=1 Tax=Lacrimispora sp. 38-1 TaxID=3125778 RepID=UPI003CEF0E8A
MANDYNEKYNNIKASHEAITLEDEVTHFESLSVPSSQTDIWEETAAGVVAEAGDYDILLWAAGYALFGNGKGIWGPGQSAEREIQLIVVPKSQRGTMKDNNFVRVGWTPKERLHNDKFTVTKAEDKITWDFNGLKFVAAPPTWNINGKAGDAELDLVYEQIGTALWNWGPFSKANENDRAGYDAFVNVNGTIRTSEYDLKIENGYGVREHIITGQSNDPVKNLPVPNWMWWLYTIQGDVKVNFFQPGPNKIGFVKYADKQVDFGPGNGAVEYETIEKWEDPRSGIYMPVKWRLKMVKDDCVVDVEIASHGRAYSHWPVATGTRMYCYLLSTMTGTVSLPDGRTVTLDNHLTVNSFCKTILTADPYDFSSLSPLGF